MSSCINSIQKTFSKTVIFKQTKQNPQLYRDCNRPLWGSLLNNQYMKWKVRGPVFFRWLRRLRMICFNVMPPRNSLRGWPMDVFLHDASLKRYVAMKQAWEQRNPPIGVLVDCLEDVETLRFNEWIASMAIYSKGDRFPKLIICGIYFRFWGCTLFVYHSFWSESQFAPSNRTILMDIVEYIVMSAHQTLNLSMVDTSKRIINRQYVFQIVFSQEGLQHGSRIILSQ